MSVCFAGCVTAKITSGASGHILQRGSAPIADEVEPAMTDPEITQADRRTAAAAMLNVYVNGRNHPDYTRILDGRFDHHWSVQAFARHRMLGAAHERAEIVAWLKQEGDSYAVSSTLLSRAILIERGEYKRSE